MKSLINLAAKALSLAVLATPANAAISMVISPGASGTANITIVASGTATGTEDDYLVVASPFADTFLPDGTSSVQGGAPSPTLTLGSANAFFFFYRDDNATGEFVGGSAQSLIGFFFGRDRLDGSLDLSDLNGTYNLPSSNFGDFNIGSFTGLTTLPRTGLLQGLGEISLQVIPEPNLTLLIAISGCAFIGRRSRTTEKEREQVGAGDAEEAI
jgi:hypothetical protein